MHVRLIAGNALFVFCFVFYIGCCANLIHSWEQWLKSIILQLTLSNLENDWLVLCVLEFSFCGTYSSAIEINDGNKTKTNIFSERIFLSKNLFVVERLICYRLSLICKLTYFTWKTIIRFWQATMLWICLHILLMYQTTCVFFYQLLG